ncbi:hypothetical protein Cadr_000021586 [Camelus dromedarius]|uniref:Uncharacterized protein n=1 Tax=Camelus dromedarius TaxID=9838 RepID=A0A5N4CVD6_CAMDR|nr:hypothetical protein Cadr_000021586 [Camelus dromedarius]
MQGLEGGHGSPGRWKPPLGREGGETPSLGGKGTEKAWVLPGSCLFFLWGWGGPTFRAVDEDDTSGQVGTAVRRGLRSGFPIPGFSASDTVWGLRHLLTLGGLVTPSTENCRSSGPMTSRVHRRPVASFPSSLGRVLLPGGAPETAPAELRAKASVTCRQVGGPPWTRVCVGGPGLLGENPPGCVVPSSLRVIREGTAEPLPRGVSGIRVFLSVNTEVSTQHTKPLESVT